MELVAGDPSSPVLLHVPHGGTLVPGWVRSRLLLPDADLAAEIEALTDHGTEGIARRAAEMAGVRPFAIVNRLSRFVVDPERFPDAREEMAAAGMGAIYTHGTRGQRIRADDPVHAEALLAAFYRPWAEAVETAVRDRLTATGRVVILDVHSYAREPLPYEVHADGPRPAICLGTEAFHTPGWLVHAARAAFAPLGEVALDTPFSGTYVPLARYGVDDRVASLMVELRRDVVDDDEAAVTRAVASLVDAVQR